jgi:hypothetical protein
MVAPTHARQGPAKASARGKAKEVHAMNDNLISRRKAYVVSPVNGAEALVCVHAFRAAGMAFVTGTPGPSAWSPPT